MLDWTRLDPDKVERVAQLLVRAACGATSIDGSGGDLAQDLRHDGPDGLTIFEVKSFTRRLTGSHKRQITGSCKRALQLHHPRRWVLVVPLNPSPAELAWFDGLRAQFPDVEFEWYGLDWLDGQIAGDEGLISYIEGADYELLRRAKQFGLEREALTSGDQLISRMDDLQRLGEGISPYWKWRFGDTPWGPGHILTAQRPEAADVDPVELTPLFSFPKDDPEAQATAERLERALRLGGGVDIPGHYVEELRVTAASEATQRLLGDPTQQVERLRFESVPETAGLPLRGSLVLEHRSGADGLSVPFTFTERVAGTHGKTLTGTDPSGLLTGRFEIEVGQEVHGRLTLDLKSPAGAFPHDALPAIRLLALCEAGDTLHFRLGPVTVTSFGADTGASDDVLARYAIVAALEVLQAHLRTLIAVPTQPTSDEDIQNLMTVARALSGQPARLPHTGVSIPLRPDRIPELLDAVPTDPHVLYGPQSGIAITLDGVRYEVPGLAMWAPKVVLRNRDELRAAAADGSEVLATFESQDDAGVFLTRLVDDPGPAYRRIVDLN